MNAECQNHYLWANRATKYLFKQTNFLDWKTYKIMNMKPPIKRIVSLPFVGQSTYQNSYVSMDLKCKNKPYPEMKVHDQSHFDTVSSSRDHYKHIMSSCEDNKSHKEEDANSFNFPGQFISESQRKFTGKPQYSMTISAKRKDNLPF